MYEELRNLSTPKDFRLDDAIQTGVDNPGNPTSFSVGVCVCLRTTAYVYVSVILRVYICDCNACEIVYMCWLVGYM